MSYFYALNTDPNEPAPPDPVPDPPAPTPSPPVIENENTDMYLR